MSMVLRKIKEDATTITLGWDPVPGCDGYVFYSAGIRRSKTMDPSRRSVRLSKGQEPYRVEAVRLSTVDYGVYPVETVPAYKKVAPRVAYKAGNSDARYCVKDFPNLRDDVASYDDNGLCTSGTRSDGSPADCPTSALEIDGREYCSLPTVGDPKKNTGSWLI